ncbi:SCO family protein [Nitrospinota bacterium]
MIFGRESRKMLIPGAVSLLVLLAAAFWLVREDFFSLPVYGELPEFSLVSARGLPVNRKNLLEHVWVANTIFTRCTETCPLQIAVLVRLQKEFSPSKEPRFLAVTLDPKFDTLEVLARYAERHGVDPERWVFLTGEEKAVAALVRLGLRLPHRAAAGRRTPFPVWLAGRFLPAPAYAHHPDHPSGRGGGGAIVHSSRFVLIDRRARVRGYYHSDDEESLQKLRKDLRLLLNG